MSERRPPLTPRYSNSSRQQLHYSHSRQPHQTFGQQYGPSPRQYQSPQGSYGPPSQRPLTPSIYGPSQGPQTPISYGPSQGQGPQTPSHYGPSQGHQNPSPYGPTQGPPLAQSPYRPSQNIPLHHQLQHPHHQQQLVQYRPLLPQQQQQPQQYGHLIPYNYNYNQSPSRAQLTPGYSSSVNGNGHQVAGAGYRSSYGPTNPNIKQICPAPCPSHLASLVPVKVEPTSEFAKVKIEPKQLFKFKAEPGPGLSSSISVPAPSVSVPKVKNNSCPTVEDVEDMDDLNDHNDDGLKIYKLGRNEELRFEVDGKKEVYIKLLIGLAEIFGSEMIRGKEYVIRLGMKIAIFTYHGCTIQIKGKTEFAYKSADTPMLIYLNAHGAIETLRRAADCNQKRGPITMIVGPNDVGKSTLCRILLNYSARLGRCPIYVDLDVSEGALSMPGSISAMMVEKVSSIELNGYDQKAPLSYFYGSPEPLNNVPLYQLVCKKMASVIHERLSSSKLRSFTSGAIINTCGLGIMKGPAGYNMLKKIIIDFEVDAVIVLDQERTYKELMKDMKKMVPNICIVSLPKSPGVVERTVASRLEIRNKIIHEYFYGSPLVTLHPHSFTVNLSEVKIFKIGQLPISESCLPIGMKVPEDCLTELVRITPTPSNILHRMMALSYKLDVTADDNDREVIETNIFGYVCVNELDLVKNRIRVLAPQPGPLPRAIFLVSDIQYMDY